MGGRGLRPIFIWKRSKLLHGFFAAQSRRQWQNHSVNKWKWPETDLILSFFCRCRCSTHISNCCEVSSKKIVPGIYPLALAQGGGQLPVVGESTCRAYMYKVQCIHVQPGAVKLVLWRHWMHLSYIFFYTQAQTPVTFCSGELWSILVVRLAHSADLRSRLRHVSCVPSVAYSTGVPGWSPIQVLTPLDGAWLRWSDGNRYVTAACMHPVTSENQFRCTRLCSACGSS